MFPASMPALPATVIFFVSAPRCSPCAGMWQRGGPLIQYADPFLIECWWSAGLGCLLTFDIATAAGPGYPCSSPPPTSPPPTSPQPDLPGLNCVVCGWVCVCVCARACMHVCGFVGVCVYVCVCMCECECVCMWECECVCARTHVCLGGGSVCGVCVCVCVCVVR